MSSGRFNNDSSLLVNLADPSFGAIDYVVFAGFLCVSGMVGIFFSCRGQDTTGEYFFGNRKIQPIPLGMSAGISFMSAIALVGTPAEMYINGYSFIVAMFFGSLGYFLACVLISYIVHPYRMTTLNHYYAERYNSKLLNYVANVMVIACIFHYMGTCMLGSVIAFTSITGGQVTIVMGLVIGATVGIFYTSIGGLKAVVWADVLQMSIMFLGILIVIFKSMTDVSGGMQTVNTLNLKYNRIHPPVWSPDFRVRHTMWNLMIGAFLDWSIWSGQPAAVQRLCSTRTRKDAYIASGVATLMLFAFSILPAWAGINVFAYYVSKGCDVYAAGWIKNNEIILYYVREQLNFPGFQGLFIASLFAGSLSSLSSGLNTASAMIWKDMVKPVLPFEVTEARATFISKLIVVAFGVLGMLWCYILNSFGGLIIQVSSSTSASMFGSYFSLFVVGIFVPFVNYKGAIAGLVTSFGVTLWLGIGSLMYGKPVSVMNMTTTTEYCNKTVVPEVTSSLEIKERTPLENIYSISYLWLTTICLLISLLVSIFVSLCTGIRSPSEVNENLLFPLYRRNRGAAVNEECNLTDKQPCIDEK